MTAIQMALRAEVPVQPWPYMESGKRVRIQSGPIEGLEGFLVEAPRRPRLIVPVPVLRQSVAMEVENRWLAPLKTNVGEDTREG
jgi:hypothetical protein